MDIHQQILSSLRSGRSEEEDTIKLLKDHESLDINHRGIFGMTFLMAAALHGYMGVVLFLLERGAVIDTQSPDGLTAIVWATKFCHVEVMKLLIEQGADVTIPTNSGETFLNNFLDEEIKKDFEKIVEQRNNRYIKG